MRVSVFSERLRLPLDEGFKNTAICLIRAMRRQHEVTALTTFGADIATEGVRDVAANKLLLSAQLRDALRAADPELVLYIPTASATPFAMLRTHVLRRFAPQAQVAMLALQPRSYDPLTQAIIRLIKPPQIIVQSSSMAAQLSLLGCRVATVHSGVDADRFAPVEPHQRAALRARLGLKPDAFVVLHVGHINEGRNVQALIAIQRAGCQAVLVGSTSTEQDGNLARRLHEAGVLVVREYVESVERYYQAADCYVFPVTSATGAIAVPLSVLEAMACNLPVVTMPYGDLATLFAAGGGVSVVRNEWEMVSHVLAARQATHVRTRDLVIPFTWPAVAQDIVQQAMVSR
jgi:glycosyltransferase involved in cell wall biosynthesis